jgi:hypothetical protein
MEIEPFYAALPNHENTFEVAYGDALVLERNGMFTSAHGIGGLESLAVRPTADARAWVDQLRAMRDSRQSRRAACHDAMVDWLYSRDAVSSHPQSRAIRDHMLADAARGIWFAQPFTPADLDAAAAWLHRQGLVEGIPVEEAAGPVQLWLTDAGVECAENFGSDARAYLDKQRQPRVNTGPTLNIGTCSGSFQLAGDNAHQVQNVGASADELQKLIASIAAIVRATVPQASGLQEQEQAALAAATPRTLDRSALKRFADWALSTVRAGATAALVPAVSAATNEMLAEAGRLAAHL